MNIKFLKLLLPTSGNITEALFEVGDRDIKIGVTDRFFVGRSDKPGVTAELFLKQFGELIIRKMLAENNLTDNYVFYTYDFVKADDKPMMLKEIKEKLENNIIRAKEKRNGIGFEI